jgi:hypothetical protein
LKKERKKFCACFCALFKVIPRRKCQEKKFIDESEEITEWFPQETSGSNST